MKINYSSAKFIFNQYRHKNQKSNTSVVAVDSSAIRVRKLAEGEEDGVDVRCTVGGKFEAESSKVWTVEEI